ncbi:MAG: regulatory iron-sulfur-containing complex subunit RicT [Thermovirgaceae bacterium]
MIIGKPRYLGLLHVEEADFEKGKEVVISSARGEEIGVVAGPITREQAETYREELSSNGGDGAPRGGEPAFQDVKYLRPVTPQDERESASLRKEEAQVLAKGRELLKAHDLEMKLVDVEYLPDRKKLFFYFTAEQRVDFRAYVRDLAKEFKTRIELRQIGVRDESKVVKGIAPCGMPCCCSYWLNRFAPICIRMVKEQNLALNPAKISGICGRLMCCLGYEHEIYRELWKNLPSPGSKIKTPSVNYVVSGIDVAARRVRVTSPGTGELLIGVDDFQDFRERVTRGESWEKDKAIPTLPVEDLHEQGLSDTIREECDAVEKEPSEHPVDNVQEGESRQGADAAERPGAFRGRRRKKRTMGPAKVVEPHKPSSPTVHPTEAKPANQDTPKNVRSGDKKRGRRRRPWGPRIVDGVNGD